MTQTQLDKVLYTASDHTTGGRDGGASLSSDRRLDSKLCAPGTPGTGTGPWCYSPPVGRPDSSVRWDLRPAK